tara:strand:+ start:18058 stop:19401 length:1344 start_codon:yes stop_codon:yes gene_type:complete
MKPNKAKPSCLLLIVAFLVICLVFGLEVVVQYQPDDMASIEMVIIIAFVLLLLASIADLALSWLPARVEFERKVSANLSLGKIIEVALNFRSQLHYPLFVTLRDESPASFYVRDPELVLRIQPGKTSSVVYKVKPTARGEYEFKKLDLQRASIFGLWTINYTLDARSKVRVYPNFAAIAGYSLLHADNQTIQLGIKKKARRGEGMDFLQLREYREGDSLRQIDWKASSRFQKLISQEYQDARDQQVLVMLDSGRRMRAQDDELSHFDHSLNATLLLSHIALKQGDSVSVFSFGGEDRFVPAFKGARNVQHLLNKMYDLYPSNEASDYLAAAQSVSLLNRKRSLLVLVSNLRDEDLDDLLVAIRLLQKKHLVLVANLVEDAIYSALEQPIVGFESAIRYAGVHYYNRQSREAIEHLKALGVWLITCRPSELSVRVVNSYLQIKNSATL